MPLYRIRVDQTESTEIEVRALTVEDAKRIVREQFLIVDQLLTQLICISQTFERKQAIPRG